MRFRPSRAMLLALCFGLYLVGGSAVRADDASRLGAWTSPFSPGGLFDARPPHDAAESAQLPPAVNIAVLPDGRLLYWEQIEGSEAADPSIALQRPVPGRARTRVLDLSGPSPRWVTPTPENGGAGDLTGSEQRQLSDGRVLVIGGTEWRNDDEALAIPGGYGRTELYGLPDARLFDPRTNGWSPARNMHFGRYYPTMLTLPDGKLVVIGGVGKLLYNFAVAGGAHPAPSPTPMNVRQIETFDPSTATFNLDTRASSAHSLPLFPRMNLLPNGKLLYSGTGMLFAPGGEDLESQSWGDLQWFDPANGTWTTAGSSPVGVRSNAFSVMLPLKPPYRNAQILVGGGTLGDSPSGFLGTPLSELITWNAASGVTASLTAPLQHARWFSSGVVLPDGEVVALSGADHDEVVAPGTAIAIRTAELFDPVTETWRSLADGGRDRTLHNTAVLLADGSILVGGHAPAPFLYGSHQPTPLSNNFKDPSFEIFRPPYLFRGPRPVIAGISGEHVGAGGTLIIQTPDALRSTLRVVLSRLPATTHVIDSDQRTVELAPRVLNPNTVKVSLPSPTVVPPGPYYVFLMKDNGFGPTPSVARIIMVGTK
jgi:hypothetical protein